MGKIQAQTPIQGTRGQAAPSSLHCCCWTTAFTRVTKAFSFRCLLFLILGASVFLSVILWIRPFHPLVSDFDAVDPEKHAAPVQASFKLQRSVSMLVAHIERLEYDIYGEIGIPNTKVSIISMHPLAASNLTYVVFGVLPDPSNAPIALLPLSILRSSFIELVLERLNLSVTPLIFGQPSSFEVLKFPGGITLIPGQSAPLWQLPQVLFNFTLNNSISQIQQNVDRLKDQLKNGLQLRSYENVFVQVTNLDGSTLSPPVIVQASVVSAVGALAEQRLKQLAEVIRGSTIENLGLDHSIFGKVKQIQLSSYLQQSTGSQGSPSPSPFLSEENPYSLPPVSQNPVTPSSYAPDPSGDYIHLSPCFCCDISAPTPANGPHLSTPPYLKSPSPSVIIGAHSPRHSPFLGPAISPNHSPTAHSEPPSSGFSHHATIPPLNQPMSPSSLLDHNMSPSPAVLFGLSPHQDQGNGKMPESSMGDSSQVFPSASCPPDSGVWLIEILGFMIPYLLYGHY